MVNKIDIGNPRENQLKAKSIDQNNGKGRIYFSWNLQRGLICEVYLFWSVRLGAFVMSGYVLVFRPKLKRQQGFLLGKYIANLTKFTVTRKQFDVCFHYTIMPCGDVHDLCAASGCCIQLKHSGKESAFRNPCEAYFHANWVSTLT